MQIEAVSLTQIAHEKRVSTARISVEAASIVHQVEARQNVTIAGATGGGGSGQAGATVRIRSAGRHLGGALASATEIV